jgi:CheY-like chemotaxis protein/signal transduction histidine kinase
MSQLQRDAASSSFLSKFQFELVKEERINFWWLFGPPLFGLLTALILDRTPTQYLPVIELCLPISFGVLLVTIFLVFSSNVVHVRTSRADRRLLVAKLFDGLSVLTDKFVSPSIAHFLMPLLGSYFTISAFLNRPRPRSNQNSSDTLSRPTSFVIKALILTSRLVLAIYGALIIGFAFIGILLWRRDHFVASFVSDLTRSEEYLSTLASLLNILIPWLCLLCRKTPFTYSLLLSFLPYSQLVKILTQHTHFQLSSFTFVWSILSMLFPTLGLSFTLKTELMSQKLRWKSLSDIKNQWKAEQESRSKLLTEVDKLSRDVRTLQIQLHDKNEFLVRLIQELRTLINNETGNIELLLETSLSSQQEECAVALEKSAELITNLINNVLYYLRAESGGIVLDETSIFSVDKLLDRVLNSERFALREDVDLYYEIDSEVPLNLQGDENVLEVIIDHLVENAVKFTHKGEICVHVGASQLNIDEVLLTIEVRDTGIGIHGDDLPNLKKPFSVVNDSGMSGSGLGLPICDKLSRLFKKGRLNITSQINKGSVVTFQGVFRKSSSKNHTFDVLSLTNIEMFSILILDDNPRVAKAIANLLKRQGFEKVFSASSTTDAENVIAKAYRNDDSFNLLLLDYFMQGPIGKKILGSEFARTLKVDMEMKNIKIIAMISRSQKRHLTSPYIDGYLLKPIKIRQVINIVRKAMLQSPLLTNLESKLWLSGTDDFSRRNSYGSNSSCGSASENSEIQNHCLHYPETNLTDSGERVPNVSETVSTNTMLSSTASVNNIIHHEQINALVTPPQSPHQAVMGSDAGVEDVTGPTVQKPNSLPLRESDSFPNALLINSNLSTTTNNEKKLRILIAEDNPLNQQVVKNLIQKLGHTCVTTNNGEEAVQEFKRFPHYDLILMDCRMPVMNGYDATIQIRNFEQEKGHGHTPIVALTAADNVDTKSHCLAVGMDACIIKPISKTTLEQVLNDYTINSPHIDATTLASDSNENWVLLVEDNPVNAKIAKILLEKQHWNVDVAVNGKQALDMVLANYHKYNVILMDIYMPVMDGLTCTTQIRQYEKEQNLGSKPIIALTANSMNAHRKQCFQAGCTEYLAKPIDPPSLVELMTKFSRKNKKS